MDTLALSAIREHPVLELRDIHKSYGSAHKCVAVLKGVNLSLYPGQMVALVAPSGAGKSTLLHIAAGLDLANQGSVFYNQTPLPISDTERTLLRRTIGFVYQFHYLLASLTALENVAVPLLAQNVPHKAARAKAQKSLAQVGLSARAQHRPSALSGGECQRVALARAIVHQPIVLLADEPTGNLDPDNAERVFSILADLVQKTHLSALIATHNMDLAQRMHRIVYLQRGRLLDTPHGHA